MLDFKEMIRKVKDKHQLEDTPMPSSMSRRKFISYLGAVGMSAAAGTTLSAGAVLGSPLREPSVTGNVYGLEANPAAAGTAGASTCYVIDPAEWGISTDGTHAAQTTDGLNAAIAYAKSAGYAEAFIPKGLYLIRAVGTSSRNPEKGGGITVPSRFRLTLDAEAELKVQPNNAIGYSCIYLREVQDVTISGGIITGDLDQHDFSAHPGSTQEWGFGIYVHGGKNVTIENVKISKCTGDCIYVGSVGMIGVGDKYAPPEMVYIRRCFLDGARRNNISITAGEGVFVEYNEITNAGTVKGTRPQSGIDIEGYGEGSIDYEVPKEITVRNNVFRGNYLTSVLNFNGYGVIIEGNHSDNTLSYGNGMDTAIIGNVLVRSDSSNIAIAGQKVSNGKDGNNVTIAGNVIKGFSSGIDARGKDVVVTGNTLSHLGNVGIGVWEAENVLVSDNAVQRAAAAAYNVDSSKDVLLMNNKAYKAGSYGMQVNKSTGVVLRGNTVTQSSAGIRITNMAAEGGDCEVTAEGNMIDLSGFEGQQSYAINIGSKCEATIQSNTIRGVKNVAIYGENRLGHKVKIINNDIPDATGAIASIQLVGEHRFEVVGNRITFNRTSGGGYGILLQRAKNSLVAQNTIYSNSNYSLSAAISTEAATESQVIHNLAIKGSIRLNASDTDIGNTIVP